MHGSFNYPSERLANPVYFRVLQSRRTYCLLLSELGLNFTHLTMSILILSPADHLSSQGVLVVGRTINCACNVRGVWLVAGKVFCPEKQTSY